MTTEDYNDIPVKYCHSCLSLHVLWEGYRFSEYCAKCGNMHIGEAHIHDWITLVKTRKTESNEKE